MNNFREWLSDNLRYFLLGIAILVVFALAIVGIRIYSKVAGPSEQKTTEKVTETTTESDLVTTEGTEKTSETAKESEKESETEKESTDESESETESGTESEASSENGEDQADTDIPEYVTVNTGLNLRNAPNSETATVIGSYEQGRVAKVLGEENGWYQVRIGGQTGYMKAEYLSPVEYQEGMEQEVETNPPAPETEAAVEVYTNSQPTYLTLKATCYLRAGTSKQTDILDTITAGTTVEFLGEEAGWYKVSVNGMVGYMGPQFF